MSGAAISTAIALIVYNVGRVIFVWSVYKLHPFAMNQFKVIGLVIFTLFSWSQIVPLIQSEWLKIVGSVIFLVIVFIVPVFVFGWEIESKNYFTLSNFLHSAFISAITSIILTLFIPYSFYPFVIPDGLNLKCPRNLLYRQW